MSRKKLRFSLVLALNIFFYMTLIVVIYQYHTKSRWLQHYWNIENATKISENYLHLQKLELEQTLARVTKLPKGSLSTALKATGIDYLAKSKGASLEILRKQVSPPFQEVLLNRDQVRLFFKHDEQFYFLYSLRLEDKGPLYILAKKDNSAFWQQWAQAIEADITLIEEYGKDDEKQILFSTLTNKNQKEFLKKYFFKNDFFPQTFLLSYGKYHSPSIKLFSHDSLKQNIVLSYKITDYMLVDSLPVILLMLFIFCLSNFIIIYVYYKD